uniref:Inter-alpha-trypsin inhibitor heavy chain family member 6 n=1 Tax=Paramormyrops kingsleyae TaxID=1676925 RepID=A0A3B3QT90_9TELE
MPIGRNFEGRVFGKSCKRPDIAKTRTKPHQPLSDGLVELAILVAHHQHAWVCHPPLVLWANRTAVQESTRCHVACANVCMGAMQPRVLGVRTAPRAGGNEGGRHGLKVTDFHIRCKVVSRYAFTTVTSSIWNQLSITKEAAFEVNLPDSAFISNFSITSNNKTYTAQVTERGVAKRIYDEAKRKGKAAGLVATKERETEKFRVVVSIPPGARTSFSLSYEELLFRRLGHYELTLGLRPTQPVQNFSLEVTVMERTGISFIKVLPLRTSRLMSSTVQGTSKILVQQTSTSPKGLNGDFILQYDVELNDLMGDVQIHDGYFVHYFAPRKLPVVPKNVIFAIDVSGSMIGTKIKQTKQAMATILSELREDDFFNIITFSDTIRIWKNGGTVKAILSNVHDAQEFVKKITAEGWTDINSALLSAGQLVKSMTQNSTRRIPLVIFLTDGEATTGVTSSEMILRNARKALGSASLFGLAFGDDADFALLRRLALENRGVARMVYEDSDAALQLKGFYDEVASPLLSDIQLSYLDDQAFDVTRSLFPNYFQGSELVVTGRIKPGAQDLKVFLSAEDSKQILKLENIVPTFSSESNVTASPLGCQGDMNGALSFVQRLWAYFTIKELLRAKLNSTDPAAQRLLAEKATNLSLKYNFVTPVTSLVVVKPDANEGPKQCSGRPWHLNGAQLALRGLKCAKKTSPTPLHHHHQPAQW